MNGLIMAENTNQGKCAMNRNSWHNSVEEEGPENNDAIKRDLTSWFSANQKTRYFDPPKIYKLHLFILILLFTAYVCHVLTGPFVKLMDNGRILLVTGIIKVICLVVSFVCLIIMIRVNGSKAATKLIFSRKSVKTYIFVYWIMRSLVLEICKGRLLFSFLLVFHCILVYSTDMWYQCDQKLLIFNISLLLVSLMYEFMVSISPFGPQKPEWMLFRVKTTPNVLSRSNYLNLFFIFFDGLLVATFDARREKYIMLAKKQRRQTRTLSLKKKKTVNRLWFVIAGSVCLVATLFISRNFLPYCKHTHDWVTTSCVAYSLMFIGFSLPGLICMPYAIKLSSANPRRILLKYVKERRIIYILLLLIVLCYVDNSLGPNMPGIIFPIVMVMFMSLDLVCESAIPKRTSFVILLVIVMTLMYNIANSMFFNPYCESLKFGWGLHGEKISYCTVKRIIHTSLVSLLARPVVGCLFNTKKMFFISANLYRSTGTNSRRIAQESYINNLVSEKERSGNFELKDFPVTDLKVSPV